MCGVLGAHQSPGAAWEGREEHGCKVVVQGKGRCKRERDLGQTDTGKVPGARKSKQQSDQNSTQQIEILVSTRMTV